ncbi:hypothetical protein CKO51_22880 [Rhodopirellula sp. SM50]|nr:hypothetical protein CKO51_22880 [Rhodopirellula sp. SM50]
MIKDGYLITEGARRNTSRLSTHDLAETISVDEPGAMRQVSGVGRRSMKNRIPNPASYLAKASCNDDQKNRDDEDL